MDRARSRVRSSKGSMMRRTLTESVDGEAIILDGSSRGDGKGDCVHSPCRGRQPDLVSLGSMLRRILDILPHEVSRGV